MSQPLIITQNPYLANPFLAKPEARLADYDYWIEQRARKLYECLASEVEREKEWRRCRDDIIHWMKYWCWVEEPRNADDMRVLPMIPWDFQEIEIRTLESIIDHCNIPHEHHTADVVYDKSRDMTYSWSMVSICHHRTFFRNSSILLGSYKEDTTDKAGDMKSPFEKIRFQMQRQPGFLMPKGFNWRKHSKHLLIVNPEGGEISGDSANPKFGRGDRKLFIWFDELAAWEHAEAAWASSSGSTNCRIAGWTPQGPHNLAARLVAGLEGKVIHRRLPWYIHPLKSQGLELVNGKYTSHWYRGEEARNSPEVMAREIDINYAASIKGWVFDNYSYAHQDRSLVTPVSDRPIVVAWDPGVYFAVVFGQVDHHGRVLIFKEMLFENALLGNVAKAVKAYIGNNFPGHRIRHVGDPAGAVRSHSNQIMPEFTELQLHHGINVNWSFLARISPVERVSSRIRQIKNKMAEFCGTTQGPCFIINPLEAPMLNKALGGEYRRRVDKHTGQVYDEIAEEHPSEDVVDATGFIVLDAFPLGDFQKKEKKQKEASWGYPSTRRRS